MMARLQPGVADDVQELVGKVEATLTGGMRHDFGEVSQIELKVQ
jgi:hypothetical protein